MQEWPIRDVARATGLTSRTLRHYEQIGLLRPSRVAPNGYRFYGEAELIRLQRILSLRATGMPLPAIAFALSGGSQQLLEAIAAHITELTERRDHTLRQMAEAQRALKAVQGGHSITAAEMMSRIDPSAYEQEVRARWGDEAWERSARRRRAMGAEDYATDISRSVEVMDSLRVCAESGDDPLGPAFQATIGDHYRWMTEQWGGEPPSKDAYAGIACAYVSDPGFAASLGGEANAIVIRTAMRYWAQHNL